MADDGSRPLLDAWLALGQDNEVILSAPRRVADDPRNECTACVTFQS
ncbi:hypothetical protein AB0L35_36270 [Streptomyces sp. NPDC052309]